MSLKITLEQVSLCRELLDGASEIVITTHKSPDGDAMGSSLAVYLWLKKLNKNVKVVVPDDVPDFLTWLPSADEVVVFCNQKEIAKETIASADLIFLLDYNHLSRTGSEMEAELRACVVPFILIDHHHQPENIAKLTYSDVSSCSTAQLICKFIVAMGMRSLLDVQIAECIYCGIMTDSGSFRYATVTAETHLIASQLIDLGLDHEKVHREVYDSNQPERMKLIGFALSEKLEVIDDAATAIVSLSKAELERFSHRPGDTEGLVNQALSLKGIKFAAFFREGNNEIKISFRSKGNFDVNAFARKSWNGGGHTNAAGGSSSESLIDSLNRFKIEVSSIKSQIKSA